MKKAITITLLAVLFAVSLAFADHSWKNSAARHKNHLVNNHINRHAPTDPVAYVIDLHVLVSGSAYKNSCSAPTFCVTSTC